MIAFLRGTLRSTTVQCAFIEVGGMGFQVWMPASSLSQIGAPGGEVLVLTSLQIRENEMTLYGFLTEGERDLFEKLITVSGVGPKIALAALSSYSATLLMGHISRGDTTALSKVPGIGKKTAQRIVLELRSALEQEEGLFGGTEAGEESSAGNGAADILYAMGFTPQEVEKACKGYDGDGEDADALVRYALKRLGQ